MRLRSLYSIKTTLLSLIKYKNKVSEKSDVNKVRERIENDLKKISQLFNDVKNILETSTYNARFKDDAEQIENVLFVLKDMEDIESILSVVSVLDEIEIEDEINNYCIKGDYYPILHNNKYSTDLRDVFLEMLSKKIKSNRGLNIFDSRCKYGHNMSFLKKELTDSVFYGLEEDPAIAEDGRNEIDRCIKGTLFGSKISNDVFDVLFLVPDISFALEFNVTGTIKEKKEKLALKNTIKYLREDGVFIYNIPYFKITKDMAFVISKLLDDVQVVKHYTNQDVKAFIPYITIIGRKKITKDAKEDIYKMLSDLKYEDIEMYDKLKEYHINMPPLQVQLFRGSILDESEIDNLLKNSPLYDSFWEKQTVSNNEIVSRPLLPFNMGQIGLVLTSGCLDGVIEEFDGQYHAIKGMVTKVKKETSESNSNNTEQSITDVYSNVVQINIFGPDGEFIELT